MTDGARGGKRQGDDGEDQDETRRDDLGGHSLKNGEVVSRGQGFKRLVRVRVTQEGIESGLSASTGGNGRIEKTSCSASSFTEQARAGRSFARKIAERGDLKDGGKDLAFHDRGGKLKGHEGKISGRRVKGKNNRVNLPAYGRRGGQLAARPAAAKTWR